MSDKSRDKNLLRDYLNNRLSIDEADEVSLRLLTDQEFYDMWMELVEKAAMHFLGENPEFLIPPETGETTGSRSVTFRVRIPDLDILVDSAGALLRGLYRTIIDMGGTPSLAFQGTRGGDTPAPDEDEWADSVRDDFNEPTFQIMDMAETKIAHRGPGRGSIVFFEPKMNTGVPIRRLEISRTLRSSGEKEVIMILLDPEKNIVVPVPDLNSKVYGHLDLVWYT